jgi:hypothetical protein
MCTHSPYGFKAVAGNLSKCWGKLSYGDSLAFQSAENVSKRSGILKM